MVTNTPLNQPLFQDKLKRISNFTWFGIFIAMFSINSINLVFSSFFGNQLNNWQMVSKEAVIFGVVAFLLYYIIPKEKLTAASIGLHSRHWGKSILLSLLLVIAGFLLIFGCIEISKLLGWKFGESTAFSKLSPFTITLVTIRAGVAEEIFMRGYLLERLTSITGKKWMAFLISTIPFGLMHYTQGYAGILIATVAGSMLALFYFWKKDLKSNIIGHFLIDFIPNILLAP